MPTYPNYYKRETSSPLLIHEADCHAYTQEPYKHSFLGSGFCQIFKWQIGPFYQAYLAEG